MAAPQYTPINPDEESRYYSSPDHVPASWVPDRPGEIHGFQPGGPRLGGQGPDQGFVLRIASRLRPKLKLQDGETADDAIRGCIGVALRRASMFSRAPVVHDLTIAFTIWGFYDADPPADLLSLRKGMFAELEMVGHHYAEGRAVADFPPDETLLMTPDQVAAAYPAGWRDLLGV